MKKLIKYLIKVFRETDKWLLFFTIGYAILGIFLILSASSISSKLATGTPYYFFKRQIISFLGSIVIAFFIMTFFSTKIYDKVSKYGTIGLIIFLLVKLLQDLTFHSGNYQVTINIGNTPIQPAEFIKIILIVYLSCAYYRWSKKEKHQKYDFLIPLIPCIIPIAFILFGGDKGSAITISIIVGVMFLYIPTKDKIFITFKIIVFTLMVGVFLLLKFAYLIIPKDVIDDHYIFSRLYYVNPCDRYEEDSGYQVCNGYIAIDNGGLWGVGIGNSTQKYLYLPASHTDFIFPIIVEELGVIISLLIILGYMFIVYRIFDNSVKAYNLKNSLICFGIGIYVLVHIFINLGGVLGIIPLTGIPLPLLSYGGSSCLAMFIAFAIVQRICIESKLARRKREVKKIVGG